MIGLDMDGVYAAGFRVEQPFVIISGRTCDEFERTLRQVNEPNIAIYLRPFGAYGDSKSAALWKAAVINAAEITDFYEDCPIQANYLMAHCVNCLIHRVDNGVYLGLWK